MCILYCRYLLGEANLRSHYVGLLPSQRKKKQYGFIWTKEFTLHFKKTSYYFSPTEIDRSCNHTETS